MSNNTLYTQYKPIFNKLKDPYISLNNSRLNFDDNDFSTDIPPSNSTFDFIPGNYSKSKCLPIYYTPSTKTQKPEIKLSDTQLTNIHEELAETKKEINNLRKENTKLKSDFEYIKKYAPILEWAKNYVERSSLSIQNQLPSKTETNLKDGE